MINRNWSVMKQRLHPQSVAEISRHSVLSLKRQKRMQRKKVIYSTINIEDTEMLGTHRSNPSKIKAWSSRPTCKNCTII